MTTTQPSPATGETGEPRLPWRAQVFAIYNSDNEPVAHTGGCGRSNEERIETARFIATTVNSHAVLREALKACEQIFLKGTKNTSDAEWNVAYELVEAALGDKQ